MRDLRNDQITRNVTSLRRRGACGRRRSANLKRDRPDGRPDHLEWAISDSGNRSEYPMASADTIWPPAIRTASRLFFGVSADSLDERWRAMLPVNSSDVTGSD